MPESLTRRNYAAHITCGCPASIRNGVRLHVGIVYGFARNRVRLHVGFTVRHQSESAAFPGRFPSDMLYTAWEAVTGSHPVPRS